MKEKDINKFSNHKNIIDKNILKIYIVDNKNIYPEIFRSLIHYSQNNNKYISAGQSFDDIEKASNSAYGEYIERYSALYTSKKKRLNINYIFKKKYNHNKSSFKVSFLPRPLYTQSIYSEFPKQNIDIDGCDADKYFNTTKNKYELLPRYLSYFGNEIKKYNNFFLFQTTTNGNGGGINAKNAKLSAIYELIERDCYLLHWVSGVAPKQINQNTIDGEFGEYLKHIQDRYKLSIYILNTTYDTNIFSCNTIIVDEILNKISVGGAAGSNVLETIKKSTLESIAILHSSETSNYLNENKIEAYSDNKINQKIRTNLYNNKEGVEIIKKIFLSGETENFNDVEKKYNKNFNNRKEELENIVEIFKNLTREKGDGYNLYFYEYKNKLIDKYDYNVYKSFVPSFMKLWLNEKYATPWSERVIEFAKIHDKIIKDEKDLNQYPHPFS